MQIQEVKVLCLQTLTSSFFAHHFGSLIIFPQQWRGYRGLHSSRPNPLTPGRQEERTGQTRIAIPR